MPEDKSEKLVNQLVSAIDKAYHRTGLLMWRSFLMGLMSGLGATIGVAVVFAFIGLLAKHFGALPVIGDWLVQLGNDIPTRN